jgi:hypothetical protein
MMEASWVASGTKPKVICKYQQSRFAKAPFRIRPQETRGLKSSLQGLTRGGYQGSTQIHQISMIEIYCCIEWISFRAVIRLLSGHDLTSGHIYPSDLGDKLTGNNKKGKKVKKVKSFCHFCPFCYFCYSLLSSSSHL